MFFIVKLRTHGGGPRRWSRRSGCRSSDSRAGARAPWQTRWPRPPPTGTSPDSHAGSAALRRKRTQPACRPVRSPASSKATAQQHRCSETAQIDLGNRSLVKFNLTTSAASANTPTVDGQHRAVGRTADDMRDECIPLRITPEGAATEITPTHRPNDHPLIADRSLA